MEQGDGPAQTLTLLFDASSDVHWMEPRDLDVETIDLEAFMQRASIKGVLNVSYADGHCSSMAENIPIKIFKALLTYDGGDEMEQNEFE
jgi:prepilin-type processing-associated H-X9-DG protein